MFNLIFTCLACAGLALGANNIDKVQYQSNDNVTFHQELKRNAIYNDDLYRITLTVNELNNYTWYNLNTLLVNQYEETHFFYIDTTSMDEIDGHTYEYDEYSVVGDYAKLMYTVNYGDNDEWYGYIRFNKTDNNKFAFDLDDELTLDYDYTTFQVDFVWYLNNNNYSLIKTAIQADITANQTANDDYAGALGDFVSIMVSGLQNFGVGVANGVANFASALFLATDSGGNVTGLSVFGGIIAIFAGLALAVGITTRVYLWVTSLGK